MTTTALVLRGLRHYWRSHFALMLGFAVVVATLAGALLVGDSVQSSLASIARRRIGRTHTAVMSAAFFNERGEAPFILLEGSATAQSSGRRANKVLVYGVDVRFWNFHRVMPPLGQAVVSPGLARELEVGQGNTVLIRVPKPSAIPPETLHGRRDDVGRTIRVRVAGVRSRDQMGEFSLRAHQGPVLAVFVPLARLQRELGVPGRVNAALLAGAAGTFTSQLSLDDLGVRVRSLQQSRLASVESDTALISDHLEAAVRGASAEIHPVFSYLATSIRAGERSIPYSLVTAVDPSVMNLPPDGIAINDWTARDLKAKPGDSVILEYFVWIDGTLLTRMAAFRVHSVVPIAGIASDREFAPEYPGIAEAKTLRDWDPPFPMNLGLIRPNDEAYWDRYRTTPKAFISYQAGRALWTSRFGSATSVRVPVDEPAAFSRKLRASLDPARSGINVIDASAMAREASRGSTDFGEYFTYFSFFVLVSALIVAGLIFRLGIEQRSREIGMLRAFGWSVGAIGRVLIIEGATVALLGCAIGAAAAVGYCALVLYGLRTWWIAAAGTTDLRLSIAPATLLAGASAGFMMAVAVMIVSLRALSRPSPRALLAGPAGDPSPLRDSSAPRYMPTSRWIAAASAASAVALLAAGAVDLINASAAFFAAAALLLTAALVWIAAAIRSTRHPLLAIGPAGSLWKLGARSTAFRPGRATAGIALIASATFLIAGLDAFRHNGPPPSDPRSGAGGFALIAESELPVFHDINTAAGRASAGLPPNLDRVRFFSCRLKPGDDASCLNLYQPRSPRVLGVPASLIRANRFSFTGSSQPNPWTLLEQELPDGVIPAIADANSITYILHKKIGDEIVVNADGSRPVRLRLMAALRGSILQSEVLVSEKRFTQAFPHEQGYRFFLIDSPTQTAPAVEAALEDALIDYGFDATAASARLASYHQVEETYLSTFQALGALGLLLGTAGLAAVLLRNVLERRRELALLRSLGYEQSDISWIIVAENLFVAITGLIAGAACAAIAVLPTVLARGGRPPFTALLVLLIAVPLTAVASSIFAVRAVFRAPILPALRAE